MSEHEQTDQKPDMVRVVGFHERAVLVVPWESSVAVDDDAPDTTNAAIAEVVAARRRPEDPRLLVVQTPHGWWPPGRALVQLSIPIFWTDGWPILTENLLVKIAEVGTQGELALVQQTPASLPPALPWTTQHRRIRALDMVPEAQELPADWFTGKTYPYPGERFAEYVVARFADWHDAYPDAPTADEVWMLALRATADFVAGGAARISSTLISQQGNALAAIAVDPPELGEAARMMRQSAGGIADARRFVKALRATLLDKRTSPNPAAVDGLGEQVEHAREEIGEAADAALESVNTVASAISVAHLDVQTKILSRQAEQAELSVEHLDLQTKILSRQAEQAQLSTEHLNVQTQILSKQATQAEVVAEDAKRDSKFQEIVTFIGALVLLPALVAAIYGANVSLPSQNTTTGFVILLTSMVATACVSLWALRAAQESRTEAHWLSGRGQRPLLCSGVLLALAAVAIALV